jgi:hypothetical protein
MVRQLSQRAVSMTRAGTVAPRATQHHGHAEADSEGAERTGAVWPAWVQRCGTGSSGGCVDQDQMAGAQRDIEHATAGGGAAWQPGGQLAYELAHVLPGAGVADGAAGGSGHADPGRRRRGAAAAPAHRDMDQPAVQQHAATLVWPAWVQRCGIGSSCGCAPEDQMAGVQRDVQRAISGGGAPLHPGVLSRMGAAFSADFSSVRVHTGSAADEVASKLKARALTAGPDIVFRGGAYSPGTQSGDRLLAHELAHVIQQRDGVVSAPVDGGPSDPLERAADAAAGHALRAVRSTPAPAGAGVGYVHGAGGGAGAAGNSPAQRGRDDRVQGREGQQAAGRADEGGKRAPVRGAAASAVTVQRDVPDVADYIAHDLSDYVAKHPRPYAHIREVFNNLDKVEKGIDDNVAADFIELQTQTPGRLEEFAGDREGRAMLDVLYQAIITGKVSSFESVQAEQILIAKAKWMKPGEYVGEAERIARLRDRAEDSPGEMAVDIVATETAHVLNDAAAEHRYSYVTKMIDDLSSGFLSSGSADNVASYFVELQTPARLKEFAGDRDGRTMLNVLYEAIITGTVSAFERMQAERILAAEAETNMATAATFENRAIFPLTTGRWSSGATIVAKLLDGKVKVFYQSPASIRQPEFREDWKTLESHYGGGKIADGIILDPGELVFVRLYDQDENMAPVPVPAIKLIDFSNQQDEDFWGKFKTVAILGATAGVGGIGAGGILGWGDTIAVAINAGSEVVNAYRREIAKTAGGKIFLKAWDIAEQITDYYNWGRLGVDGLQFVHGKVSSALEEWRQKATSAERETIATVQQEIVPWLDAVKQAETAEAEKYLEAHPPKKVEEKAGQRHAEIEGGHEVKEVSGGLGCEFHSNGGTPVPCPWERGGHLPLPEPRYQVYFEVQLPRGDWGRARDAHFRLANENMLDMLGANAQLRSAVERRLGWKYEQIEDWVMKNPTKGIPGFTWHHALTSQANGVPGVLQLVITSEHVGKPGLYHPPKFGGYNQWAVPFGAPP